VVGAECQPHGQLVPSAAHRARDDAVEAHGREEQRAEREPGEEHRAQARLLQRPAHDLVHRPELRDRELRVHPPHRGPHLRHQPRERAVAAQREAERVLRVVLVAQVDLRPAVLVDVVVPRVLHDADDAERVAPEVERRPDRAAGREELPGQRPVDHRLAHAARRRRRERPAGEDADAERLEVARARREEVDERAIALLVSPCCPARSGTGRSTGSPRRSGGAPTPRPRP
jgi:hypothetical protein